LHAGSNPGRLAFVSAASGLVRVGPQLYVVADDELHLAQFSLQQDKPGQLIRLLDGELPQPPKQRKKLKPDLEILTLLPPDELCPQGALLALGSGSKQRRCRGVLAPLDANDQLTGPMRILDASVLFTEIATHFTQLNLEGAWRNGNELCLLQRGNKGGSPNAVIRLDLEVFRLAIGSGDVLPAIKPLSIQTLQLGELAGVPLSFTDAVALPDGRWLFSAVAEDTDDAYQDGACIGAAIGMADRNQVVWIKPVLPTCKIEGIEVIRRANDCEVLLVTDADDAAVPAQLLSTRIELP
jgi:hypothetical protein